MHHASKQFLKAHRMRPPTTVLLPILTFGCGGPAPLTVEMPLHLEDHLDVATISGSEVPADPPQPVEWRFDEPQPDWRPILPYRDWPETRVHRTSDALRVTLAEGRRDPNGSLHGGVYVDLPDWRPGEWAEVRVRARATSGVRNMLLGLNPRDQPVPVNATQATFQLNGGITPIVSDGTVQTYVVRPAWGDGVADAGPWRRVGLGFFAPEPASIDILSVSIVPKGAVYADAPHGVRRVSMGERLHRAVVTHAPGSIAYRVRVPPSGRLDVALGTLPSSDRVVFRISSRSQDGAVDTLLQEGYADAEQWAQRSVDLSRFAGQTLTLALETETDRPGTVAIWGAPTLSRSPASGKPNVIFYIIDGGSAEYMSVYGYNRRTTPNLERLAAEGALFEQAYSNASWTRPSTASFLTSLQHSVLGGLRGGANPVPEQVSTIAEHLHEAGYQTAEFTSNPNAGRTANLDRGNDAFRDAGVRPNHSISSVILHGNFWQWRTTYPGEPYWVHVQTTDVHSGHHPVAPFTGLFISPERRRLLDAWDERLDAARGSGANFRESFERTGISRAAYFAAQRDLHDETMAHQDYQLGRLVARLKARGEWDRTLLIVAADHGVWAGAEDYGLLMRDSLPPHDELSDLQPPMFAPGVGRIPMIVIWPGRIAPEQRFTAPVSMLDMLPTILDLLDLPPPGAMQGQSLAPLLLGEGTWEPRPVILDEFEVDGESGELRGRIEVIDGRWAASLQINPTDPGMPHPRSLGGRRPVPLLLYDLWNDPACLHSLHAERPDLVEKYTRFLERQFEAHLALGRHLTPSEASPLTPEQLEALRSLGYIR